MNRFSIDFPEYHIAGLLKEEFSKKSNFSVSIPLSRQQKFYDLLLYNAENKKCLTFQVKSSRTYLPKEKSKTENVFDFLCWLNTFQVNNYSDYYLIFITYPIFDIVTFKPKTKFGTKILIFSSEEMLEIISNIKTKSGKLERFFGFGFRMDENRLFGTRGFSQNPDFTKHLFEHKIKEVKRNIL